MANWSDFEVSFYDTNKKLDKIEQELRSHIVDNWFYMENPNKKDNISDIDKFGWSGVSEPIINKFDGQLSFSGQGRWHGPYLAIKYIVKKYNTTASYHDSEPGCSFYHNMEFINGYTEKDEEYDYLSKESIDYYSIEKFAEEYDWVLENPYENKEILKKLIDLKIYTQEEVDKYIKKNKNKKKE